MRSKNVQIKDVLKEQLSKPVNQETSIEIRLFDHKTGKAFYKHLTSQELLNVMKSFSEMKWD